MDNEKLIMDNSASATERSRSLPKGWEIKKLESVCEILDNLRKPITKRDRVDGDYPYYGATGILSHINDYIFSEKLVLIGEDGAKWFSGANSSFIVEGKYWVNNHAHVIRSNRNIIIDEWVVYFLNFSNLEEFVTGMTVPKLNQGNLKTIPIPIPPLPEQKRIVSILDKTFAEIAKAKANAEQNLKNAKELFDSYLQGVFDPSIRSGQEGDDWVEKSLGEVCKVIGGGTPSKKNEDFYTGNILWASVRDMKTDIIRKTEFKITEQAVLKSSTNIIPKGNVIIATRVGLGKVCLVENDTAINQDLKGIIPNNEKQLSVDFLFRWFKSISNKIIEEGTGATVQGVKLTFIKALNISLPPIKEQKQIVEKLDKLSAETKKLETVYQQKLEDLEDLKKSVLQKAFNGELTMSEP